jgi:hypothetical protein
MNGHSVETISHLIAYPTIPSVTRLRFRFLARSGHASCLDEPFRPLTVH